MLTQVNAARAQFGVSLGFHIIFASLGVGLPLMMFIAEGIGLFKRDVVWYALARRWSIAFTILYAIGAVSGTIIEFELGLLWPRFMQVAGGIVGIAFTMEAFAFFLEGVFLGLYLFGWKRLSPVAHWLCSVPLLIGGLASSEFIVAANAWMQSPSGFTTVNGRITNVEPIGAMLNPFFPTESFHMTIGAYEATAFGAAAVYAFAMLRGRRTRYERYGFALSMIIGTVTAPLQVWIGDVNAEIVATYQHAKLAAMELVFTSQKCAPELFGGWPHGHSTEYGLKIPCLLSWLAYHDVTKTVVGLEHDPAFFWPPYWYVHVGWQLMLLIGGLAAMMTAWFWLGIGLNIFRNWRGSARHLTQDVLPIEGIGGKLTLWGGLVLGPLSFLAIEFGWMLTELGRQPWAIFGVMLTADAVQTAPWLNISFIVFGAMYVILGFTTAFLLYRNGRSTWEAGTPREMIIAGRVLE